MVVILPRIYESFEKSRLESCRIRHGGGTHGTKMNFISGGFKPRRVKIVRLKIPRVYSSPSRSPVIRDIVCGFDKLIGTVGNCMPAYLIVSMGTGSSHITCVCLSLRLHARCTPTKRDACTPRFHAPSRASSFFFVEEN